MKIISKFAEHLMRYSVVILLFWYGVLKFTATEAADIEILIKNSPILKYIYMAFSQRAGSSLIGIVEIITALFIALQPFTKKIGKIGAVMGSFVFLNTIIFLFTTPGIWKVIDGVLMPVSIANFIMKDFVCLGFCLWSLTNSSGGNAKSVSAKK